MQHRQTGIGLPPTTTSSSSPTPASAGKATATNFQLELVAAMLDGICVMTVRFAILRFTYGHALTHHTTLTPALCQHLSPQCCCIEPQNAQNHLLNLTVTPQPPWYVPTNRVPASYAPASRPAHLDLEELVIVHILGWDGRPHASTSACHVATVTVVSFGNRFYSLLEPHPHRVLQPPTYRNDDLNEWRMPESCL